MNTASPKDLPIKALALAEDYEKKSAFRPALNIYQSLLKTTEISLRVKINLGNVHFKLKNFPTAIKHYKMALDQVGQNKKVIYCKIMQNIGLALVQQELYSEAAVVFAYIVKDSPEFKAFMHLILCWYGLRRASKVRRCFSAMFTLPELKQVEELEKIVFLIAPFLEDNEDDGFNWCLDVIRITNHAWIADNLEVARIVKLLRSNKLEKALNFLEKFELRVKNLTENSRINLSFVFLHLKRYNDVICLLKGCTQSKAYNNYGVLKFIQEDYESAGKAFQKASEGKEKLFEPTYNLGLLERKMNNLKKAKELFEDLEKQYSLPCSLMVKYQTIMVTESSSCAFHNLKKNLELFGLSYVSDPIVLRRIAELYKALSNFKMAAWFFQEAYIVNPLS